MRRRTAAGATIMALLVLTGCGGAPGSGNSGGEAAAGDAGAPERAADLAPAAPKEDAADGAPSDDGGSGVIAAAAQLPVERQIIHTVELSIRTDDVAGAARRAATIATTALGFVADEHASGDDSATLTLKVPAGDHADVVARLEGLGKVTDRSRSTQDVTQEVTDTASRIESQRSSITRIRALLAEAGDLSDIISIEAELAEREADLDSLLSRQELLAGLTSMATITVSLYATGQEPPDDDDRGFLAGLAGGWDAFVSTAAVMLTVIGAVLPFAAVAVLVGYPAYVIIRRRRTTQPDAQPDAPPAA